MTCGRTLFVLLFVVCLGMCHEHEELIALIKRTIRWRPRHSGVNASHPLIDFTHNLTRMLLKNGIMNPSCISKNIVISPIGVVSTILMLAMTTRGSALIKNIERAVNSSIISENIWQEKMAEIVEELSVPRIDHVVKRMVNEIVVADEDLPIRKEFLDFVFRVFQTVVQKKDFSNSENVRQINERVSRSTDGLIKSILPRESLRRDAIDVLLSNAFFFKGFWLWQFEREQAQNQPFSLDTYQSIAVPTMHAHAIRCKTGRFPDLRATTLYIPFTIDRHGLLIVLPDEVDGLREVEKRLYELNYSTKYLMENMVAQETSVWLPKFNISYQIELSEIFKTMNIVDLSAPEADLNGISDELGSGDWMQIYHQSFLEVDEQQTKAPVDTSFWIGWWLEIVNPREFRADHPFLFYVIDIDNDDLPLLMGLITDPRH